MLPLCARLVAMTAAATEPVTVNCAGASASAAAAEATAALAVCQHGSEVPLKALLRAGCCTVTATLNKYVSLFASVPCSCCHVVPIAAFACRRRVCSLSVARVAALQHYAALCVHKAVKIIHNDNTAVVRLALHLAHAHTGLLLAGWASRAPRHSPALRYQTVHFKLTDGTVGVLASVALAAYADDLPARSGRQVSQMQATLQS